uniref:ShKT domain-containing protein n=1 Tax=Ditylenchus dipsaci TaxID=166011 RepID=A0A915CS70_9BILA
MFGDGNATAERAAIALVGKTGIVTRPDGTGQSPATPFSCMTTDIEAAEDVLKCARHCYLVVADKSSSVRMQTLVFKCKDKKSNAMCLGSLKLWPKNVLALVVFVTTMELLFANMCDDSDPILRNSVRTACPKTCGQCSSNVIGGASISPPAGIPPVENNCVDLNGADCEKNILLCENVYYSRLMSSDCRKTCGYCLPPNTPCQDNNTADCQRWNINGFCTNTDYPKGMKLLQCPLTCGLCKP